MYEIKQKGRILNDFRLIYKFTGTSVVISNKKTLIQQTIYSKFCE
jgi:hypothetical protein